VRDELLMARYQRGDRAAMESLVKRHKVRIYNFVLRQVGHRETAADISQDVFLRVAQKASEFKHEARFSTWLYTIARNLCIDHLRKQQHRRHPSLDQELSSEGGTTTLGDLVSDPHPRSSVERGASATQVRQSILRAVAELPPEQKEVFLLREIGNLPFKEIAEVTATGENTVKSRMRYALERLQKALSDFEEYARELK
jgi:RNA polymerase sigma-70 factor (ECF subfamily)